MTPVNVILTHKLRLLDVAARLRQRGTHAALGFARRNTHCRQRTLGTRPIYCIQYLLGRVSVLFWQPSDTLCTTGFCVDDVISAHKPKLLDVAAQLHCSLGLGYKLCAVTPVAGQRMHGPIFRALKVTSKVATQRTVYDCLVILMGRAM